jgi:hypothetical protein
MQQQYKLTSANGKARATKLNEYRPWCPQMLLPHGAGQPAGPALGTQLRIRREIIESWRGKPLVSHQVIVQLIGSTTTEKGLKVYCELDTNHYPNGVKATDREMNQINISYDEFHGEWSSWWLGRPDATHSS